MLNVLLNSDVSIVADFINTTGFPVACVILLAYYIKELNKQHKEEVVKLSEKIDTMTNAINDLTLQLAKVFIIEKMEDSDK